MEEVKLQGFWPSNYCHAVIWALKLKGVDFDYIEEDIYNKSQLLLEYNPIYKKVPVLVHQGRPLAESPIILEYIDETWPQYPLLPTHAHDRALARFWIDFGAQKVPTFGSFFASTAGGEEGEKAAKEALEVLKILEERGLGNNKFFGGETLNMVDLVHGWLAYIMECIEELVGVKLIQPTTLPRLYAWVQNFKQLPVIKENLPDRQRLLAHLKNVRDRMLANA
ncbi:hypothetical protein TIFTF001_030524 [Ficus carica]|uniref:glutathione transferase n=1 Tax=Ficus carica TaxID=3494 RepID=A0AA88J497_FICCA|nr:hypothetical protein TIFTF001_030524 [Ficus carica]